MSQAQHNPLRLRVYAEAVERLQAMEERLSDLPMAPVCVVKWGLGSSLHGHDELSAGVSQVATTRFHEMAEQAIREQRLVVESLRIEAIEGRHACVTQDGKIVAGEPI